MPRKPKNQPTTADNSVTANGTAPAAETAAAPAKKPAAKSTRKPAAKKTSAKKKSATPAAKKTRTRPASPQTESTGPTDAEIQLRAYFIAERRVQLSLPGDAATDWLQARKELMEEASQPRS